MEFETSPAPSPQGWHIIFFNDHGLRAGWRLLIYIAMIVLLLLAVSALGRLFAGPGGGANAQRAPQLPEFLMRVIQAIVELVLFLALLFLAWIMSKIERRRMGVYGLPLQRSWLPVFFSGYFFWGFLPLTVLLLILRACRVFYFGSLSPLNGRIAAWFVLWLFLFLLVGLFEEYLFRGYALHTLAEGIGFWPAAIIMAVLFARAHMGNSGETKVGVMATAVFALFAAATLWRTGNLWLAVGSHAGWDWGQSFFYGVNDSGFQAPGHLLNPHVQGPDWLTGGTVGPEGSALTLVLWALMTLFFLLLYRRRGPAVVMTMERTG
jgi:membrane protease YdiL (CAAX protease family)